MVPHYLDLSSLVPSPDLPRRWAMPQIRRAPAHHFFFQCCAVFHIVFAFGLRDAWWTRPVNCGNDRLSINWMAYNVCNMIQKNLNGIRWMYTCTCVLVVGLLGIPPKTLWAGMAHSNLAKQWERVPSIRDKARRLELATCWTLVANSSGIRIYIYIDDTYIYNMYEYRI